MHTLTVALGERSYPIHIGAGLIAQAELIVPALPQKRVAIVTNETVAPLYLERFATALREAGVEPLAIVVPDGETHKEWSTLNRIFDALIEQRCERRTTIAALGGGVIGDLAGFAAALYQRGVPYVQVPTTLLAQVDSAVGGKTAINHRLGKNMIGAFYQPRVVLADTDTLATLPERELAAGIAEIIKYGLIRDRAFFEWLEAHVERLVARESEALAYAIERSCRNKAEVVARDERESGERALLNFGHTFGHAIEAGLGYGQWLHGEAVAAGMVLAARVSAHMGLIGEGELERVRRILGRAKLPVDAPHLGAARYLDLMGRDKKVSGGRLQFVLLKSIGSAFVSQAPEEALHAVLERPAAHA
jgi:3-dehydroquinate synthase